MQAVIDALYPCGKKYKAKEKQGPIKPPGVCRVMEIYVSNLSYQVDDDELHRAFSQFGQVRKATVVKDKTTNQSRGFGFVDMPVAEEGSRAIAELHGKALKGRPISASEARPRTVGGRDTQAPSFEPRPKPPFNRSTVLPASRPRPAEAFPPREPNPAPYVGGNERFEVEVSDGASELELDQERRRKRTLKKEKKIDHKKLNFDEAAIKPKKKRLKNWLVEDDEEENFAF